MEEKLLCTSNNNLDVIQICQILKDNKIPFVLKEEGIGQYMHIAMGTTSRTQEIYVSEENFEEARNLIQNFADDDKDTDNDEEEYEDDSKYTKRSNFFKKIIGFYFFVFPLLVIILIIIFLCLGIL